MTGRWIHIPVRLSAVNSAMLAMLARSALLAAAVILLAACDEGSGERKLILGWSADDRLGGLEARERAVLAAPPGGRRTLTIAATGDLKGWITLATLFPRRKPAGLAHLAPIIRELRELHPSLILLDAGDALRGAPSATIFTEGSDIPTLRFPILALMNALQYDAMALGNFDLGLGWASLAHAQFQSGFSWLAANLERSQGGTLLEPYKILERKGVRVAVLGLTTPRVVAGLDPRHLDGLVMAGLMEAARRWVPFLRRVEGADVVIGLIHAGLNDGYQRDVALRSSPPWGSSAGRVADEGGVFGKLRGFDLIVSGDAHRLSPRYPDGPESPYAVPVLQPGARGNGLALATLSMEERNGRWVVKGMTRRTYPARPEADPESLRRVEKQLRETRARLDEATAVRFRRVPRKGEFFRCAGALSHHASRFLAGKKPGAPSHLSLLPMRWRFHPPRKSELGAPLRRAHLYRWMTYADTPVQARLTGRQIQLLLEGYVRHRRKWRVRDLEVFWPGGLEAVLAEKGSRIVSLRLAGEGRELSPHTPYPVWLTAYIWHGGMGLAQKALLHPRDQLREIPISLRAGLFALLSDPAAPIPPQCKRWLEH